MAIAIRSITTDIGTQDPISVVTPTDTEVGDFLLIITANDFYALSNIQTPTVTGSPTVAEITDAAADAGTDAAHIKAWWAIANTAGANTITENETGSADEDKILAVYVLTGVDTDTPIDIADSDFGSSSTSHVAPSVDPTEVDSFLICHTSSGGGAATSSYTPPGGMDERYDLTEGGISGAGATEQLASGDATGTRTFTAASSVPWAACTIALRTAAGGSTVTGSGAVSLGALTAAATGGRTVAGTAAVALGGLTATASGGRTVAGTAAVALGGLTATASGERTATGAGTVTLGALTATASGERTVVGAGTVALGALTVTAVVGSEAGSMALAAGAAPTMNAATGASAGMTPVAAGGPTMRGA